MKNDWRYVFGLNMKGLTFKHKTYEPYNPKNDHDHCEFCGGKFSKIIEGSFRVGYQTIRVSRIKLKKIKQDSWVCEKCFNDFQEKLDLRKAN